MLTKLTRREIRYALTGASGDEVSDAIDAGAGTLSTRTKIACQKMMGSAALGQQFVSAVETGSGAPLSENFDYKLASALASIEAANDVITHLNA